MPIKEALRRILTLFCVVAAVWYAVTPQPIVYVRHMPLSELIPNQYGDKERIALITAAKDGKLTPEQSDLAWRLVRAKHDLETVRPDQWRLIVDQVTSSDDGSLYLPLRNMPDHPYKPYQMVTIPNGTVLMVDVLDSSEAFNRAPASMVYPMRVISLFWLLGALLLYIMMPWPPKPSGNVYGYKRLNSIILPDWLGFGLAAFFTALPMMVISCDSNFTGTMQEVPWSRITAWSMLGILPGLSIIVVAWFYSCTYIRLNEKQVEFASPAGVQKLDYEQITSIEPHEFTSPEWLKRASLILMYGSIFTMSAIYIMLSQKHAGAKITLKNGRTKSFLLEYLPRYDEMLKQLQSKSQCELKGFEL
ncbi:MAG: hypothetical protein ACYC1M_04660 [Armatimonadota bacterium]